MMLKIRFTRGIYLDGISGRLRAQVEMIVVASIFREAFWGLAKYKYPTHQIVFCTENALKTISFKSHYTL